MISTSDPLPFPETLVRLLDEMTTPSLQIEALEPRETAAAYVVESQPTIQGITADPLSLSRCRARWIIFNTWQSLGEANFPGRSGSTTNNCNIEERWTTSEPDRHRALFWRGKKFLNPWVTGKDTSRLYQGWQWDVADRRNNLSNEGDQVVFIHVRNQVFSEPERINIRKPWQESWHQPGAKIISILLAETKDNVTDMHSIRAERQFLEPVQGRVRLPPCSYRLNGNEVGTSVEDLE